jgi:hypothetical protein
VRVRVERDGRHLGRRSGAIASQQFERLVPEAERVRVMTAMALELAEILQHRIQQEHEPHERSLAAPAIGLEIARVLHRGRSPDLPDAFESGETVLTFED